MVYRFISSSVYPQARKLFFNLCSSVFICGFRVWEFVRTVSGDDAYECYIATRAESEPRLSPGEFYRQRLERKYNNKDSPARCC